VQNAVSYLNGASSIEVHALIEGADGVGAYGIEVYFGASPLELASWSDGTFLQSTGRAPYCFDAITETSADVGCGTFGMSPPGASGDGLLAVLRFTATSVGVACIMPLDAELATIDGEPLPVTASGACISVFPEGGTVCANPLLPSNADPDGDALINSEEAALGTNPCSPDSDGDLCTDWAELHAAPSAGGRRDPLNRWDFYDVNRSGRVDAADIGLVRVAFGISAGMPGYASARDRSYIGPDAWDLGAPDGVIDAVDSAAVKAQFNHTCVPA
jgi:hypothetical protein